ncbi:hypothetical protein HK101_010364 [Irineochytrium annulatum]|nr:hypothetical protein HK101_010364 [Irineochytrium annulatum]
MAPPATLTAAPRDPSRDARRWLTLLSACLSLLTAGSLYGFGSFEESLRSRFGFSDQDLNLVSAMGITATYLPFLVLGPIWDRCGVKATMGLSTLCFGSGFFLMYLAFIDKLPSSMQNVAAIAIYYFIAGVGACASYLACFAINMINFDRRYSGLLTGIQGIFFGLSGTVFSQIYAAYFSTDTASFLLFLTITVFSINLWGMFTMVILPHPTNTKADDLENAMDVPAPVTSETVARSEGLAGVKMGGSGDDDAAVKDDVGTVVLREESEEGASSEGSSSSLTTVDLSAQDVGTTARVIRRSKTGKTTAYRGVGMSPLEILRSSAFWLFGVCFIWQQGNTYFSNIGTIVKELAPADASAQDLARTTGLHVTLLSVFNCVSRIIFGAGSDVIVARFGVDRSLLLLVGEVLSVAPLAVMGLAHDVTPPLLAFSSVMTGFAWGSTSAIWPPMTADFFGMKNYGVACAFIMSGIPIGLFTSNILFGHLTDSATAEGCVGTECFRTSFQVFLGIQMLPVALSAVLFVMRTRLRRTNREAEALRAAGVAV